MAEPKASTSSASRNLDASLENGPVELVRIGQLLRMQLKNFMCHANLVVDFNKRINIFVGNNGSGKSAILTAIVIGLGGNASTASRSTNIKQLILRGESSCSVEIHLSNEGINPFDPEKYGRKIIVLRTINASGASAYKIKDEQGRIQSTSVTDLRHILMYMNIQVDNPICILNQEAARTFLKESDPKKLYSLFLKATQIETIIDKLNQCIETYGMAKTRLTIMEQQEVQQKNELVEIENKYKTLKSIESLNSNINILNQELLWCHVRNQNEVVSNTQNEIEEMEKNLQELRQKIENRAELLQQFKNKKIQLETEAKNSVETHSEKKQIYNTIRTEFSEKNTKFMDEKRTQKLLSSKIKHLENELLQLRQNVAERSGNYMQQIEKMKQANEQKLQELSKSRDEKKMISENIKRDIEIMKNNIEAAENGLESLRERRRELMARETHIKGNLHHASQKSNNRLAIYGQHMPRILSIIDKHHKNGAFSEKPLGPFGEYIEVKNENYRAIIETTLGGYIQAFCFSSIKDCKTFEKIIQKEMGEVPKFMKIVSKFVHEVYDIRRGMVKPVKGTTSILNEIKISNPVIKNILIDQMKIETILIANKSKEAQYYTSDQSNVPKNLSKIISCLPYSEYFPAPKYRSYGLKLKPCRFLQANMEEYKNQLQNEMIELKSELDEITLNWNKYQKEITEINEKIRLKNKGISSNHAALAHLSDEILEIKNIEYPTENDIRIIEKEIAEIQIQYDEHKMNLEIATEKVEELEKEVQQKEKDLSNYKKEINSIELTLQNKQNKIDKIDEEIKNFEKNEKYIVSEIKETEMKQKVKTQRLDLANEELNKKIEKAQNLGDKIDNNRTENEIKDLIQKKESQKKLVSLIKEDINVIKELRDQKREAHNYILKCVEATRQTLQSLDNSRLIRFRWIQKFKQGITLNVKSVFLRILKIRNYRGDIKMNHNQKLLEIQVIPQDKEIQNAVSNTKSLSGGERSFSTLAFLISLWSSVSQPFYFLDEYDVFTDEVNRSIMTKLLIHEAKRRSDRQYAFFTPQDMSFVEESIEITFHRLQDHRQK